MACRVTKNRHQKLAFRLHWRGRRWWERTGLPDTKANRDKLERTAGLISAEMRAGTFSLTRYLELFPNGNRAAEFRTKLAGPALRSRAGRIPTLNDFYATWIARQQPPFVRPAQALDYRRHMTGYVLAAPAGDDDGRTVGELLVTELRVTHLKSLRQRLTEGGLTLKTVRNIVDASFRAMMRDAREELDTLAISDAFAALRWPRLPEREPDPFTPEERDAILSHFAERQPFYYPWVVVRFWTGVRPGEAAALRIGDLDVKGGTLRINKSRHMGVDGATKTRGSTRTILLLPDVLDVLRDLVPLHADPTAFLFTNRYTGGPINQGEWAREYWGRCLEATGIRPRPFYNTRHTFISTALTNGVNLKWLAEYCGTSVEMIEKHYGRFMQTHAATQSALLVGAQAGRAARPVQSLAAEKPDTVAGFFQNAAEKPFENQMVPRGFEPLLPT
jgi:integrase